MGNKASQRGGVSSYRETGQRGNKRGKEAQKRRTELRLAKPRVQTALGRAAADRAWLDAESARVEAIVAEWTAEVRARQAAARAAGEPVPPVPPLHDLANRSAGDLARWTIGQAAMLLSDGYSLEHVCRKTGWGGWWFRTAVGNDGYARTERELSA